MLIAFLAFRRIAVTHGTVLVLTASWMTSRDETFSSRHSCPFCNNGNSHGTIGSLQTKTPVAAALQVSKKRRGNRGLVCTSPMEPRPLSTTSTDRQDDDCHVMPLIFSTIKLASTRGMPQQWSLQTYNGVRVRYWSLRRRIRQKRGETWYAVILNLEKAGKVRHRLLQWSMIIEAHSENKRLGKHILNGCLDCTSMCKQSTASDGTDQIASSNRK